MTPIEVVDQIERAIVVYFVVINSIYLVLMVLGFFTLRQERSSPGRSERDAVLTSRFLPTVSVIAPAYNEAATIRDSVRSFLDLQYPALTVIVVNDGSTDDTLAALIDEFHLYRASRSLDRRLETASIRAVYESRDPVPLVVVDKDNGGKADALNAGLGVARSQLVAAVDADSLLESGSLLAVVRPFLETPEETVATGGIVRVANGCRVRRGRVEAVASPTRLIPLFQTVEYLRAFLGGRVAFSFMNALLLISGAFGMFDRRAVIEAGGFSRATVGEDMELVVRLHRRGRRSGRPYRIVFVPDPVCWTEVPESMRVLGRQRHRWQRGTLESLTAHRAMVLNPRHGAVGLFAMPYFVAFELLGPVVELAGYVIALFGLLVGIISVEVAALFFVVALAFGLVLSTGAVLLEELTTRRHPAPLDVAKLLGAAILENLGYRQVVTAWRVKGMLDGLRGHTAWGVMERRGFRSAAS